MKGIKLIAIACATAVVLALGLSATAQDLNPLEKTFLTFSAPVELPGMTLPAGTYVFKLADTPGRNVVQVLSQDEKDVKGQFLFMQHRRPETSTETVVTFRETREGATPAVQYWYYPNERIGKEFIYPRDQAMRIAARTGATVLSDNGPVSTPGQATASQQTAGAAAGSLAGNRGAPDRDTDADTQADAAVGTGGQDLIAQAETQTAPNELPRTASPFGLAGLLGLLSLAGAAGVRFFHT